MLRTRFGLAIHRESKEVSGYVLTAGKNGNKLRPAGQEPPGMMLGRSASTGQRTLNASHASVSQLAALLADVLSRPVEDRTGLSGMFDFSMEWTPDPSTESAMGKGRNQETPDYAQTGPSIFTAIQESLGLKLESGKTSVEVIVIDHAEKPTAN